MYKYVFLCFIFLGMIAGKGYSQTKLRFMNNTGNTISAAYAKYIDEQSGWTSYGWWNIKPGESKLIDLGNYNYTNVYVYGFYKNTGWGNGNYKFCVDFKKAFTFPNADGTCNYEKRTFSEFAITTGKTNTWNFNSASTANNSNKTKQEVVPSGNKNLSQQQITEFVNRHNYWREKVGSPRLVWSEQLASYAYEWAKYLADNDLFQHRSQNKYGENIFMCYSCTSQSYPPSSAIDNWASEIEQYNGESITNSNYTIFGHYTQIIWCETTQVGCAMVPSKNGNMVVVCNYSPAGNMIGNTPVCD